VGLLYSTSHTTNIQRNHPLLQDSTPSVRKEPHVSAKERYVSTKEPYIPAKEPYTSAHGPLYIRYHVCGALSVQRHYLLRDRTSMCCERALCTRKRALHIRYHVCGALSVNYHVCGRRGTDAKEHKISVASPTHLALWLLKHTQIEKNKQKQKKYLITHPPTHKYTLTHPPNHPTIHPPT